jgi:hypothetical protein
VRDVNSTLGNADTTLHMYLGYFIHSPGKAHQNNGDPGYKYISFRSSYLGSVLEVPWWLDSIDDNGARCCKEVILGERFRAAPFRLQSYITDTALN